MPPFTESIVESATLAWLGSLGWTVKHSPEIASGELAAKRNDFGQIVLMQWPQDALARLSPTLPAEALDDAFRKLVHPEGPTLEAHNHAVHRSLVDGVAVEHRVADGAIRGCSLSTMRITTLGWRPTNSPSARDPHSAGVTEESISRMGYWAAKNVVDCFDGKHIQTM